MSEAVKTAKELMGMYKVKRQDEVNRLRANGVSSWKQQGEVEERGTAQVCGSADEVIPLVLRKEEDVSILHQVDTVQSTIPSNDICISKEVHKDQSSNFSAQNQPSSSQMVSESKTTGLANDISKAVSEDESSQLSAGEMPSFQTVTQPGIVTVSARAMPSSQAVIEPGIVTVAAGAMPSCQTVIEPGIVSVSSGTMPSSEAVIEPGIVSVSTGAVPSSQTVIEPGIVAGTMPSSQTVTEPGIVTVVAGAMQSSPTVVEPGIVTASTRAMPSPKTVTEPITFVLGVHTHFESPTEKKVTKRKRSSTMESLEGTTDDDGIAPPEKTIKVSSWSGGGISVFRTDESEASTSSGLVDSHSTEEIVGGFQDPDDEPDPPSPMRKQYGKTASLDFKGGIMVMAIEDEDVRNKAKVEKSEGLLKAKVWCPDPLQDGTIPNTPEVGLIE